MSDLFAKLDPIEPFDTGAVLLRGFCAAEAEALVREIETIAAASPFRSMQVPGGGVMSVAMTNCGAVGWVTDRSGYRYSPIEPMSDQPWPAMPENLRDLAVRAAAQAGYADFAPDACLINRYAAGARMGLHRDKDEKDFTQPIVSVSLGCPATFLWGGAKRADKTTRIELTNGDVVVWGGPTRRAYHGVAPLKAGNDPLTGAVRYNLTFRKAL
jgi:alkylated DNA repair protein (DNA oxidative demethylase)